MAQNKIVVRQNAKVAAPVKKSSAVKHFNVQEVSSAAQAGQQAEQPIQQAVAHPLQATANEKMRQRQAQRLAATQAEARPSAKELKERAIKKALSEANQSQTQEQDKKKNKLHFGFPRIALALSCAAAAVFAIMYFVNLNMPDISLKVAAMQTGFDASYPSYVPHDYALSGITSEDGKVTLNFRNQTENSSFSLIEEKSAWDSSALLNNYVKDEYGDNYSTIKEQGLTIYVDGSDATWVNRGVLYKIKTSSGTLSKKQIKSIAVSL
jgi:hypothetical protein